MDEEQNAGEDREHRVISRRLKTWLGVAASVAGVLAGVLLVIDRWGPKADLTIEDWRSEANEFCDRYYAESSGTSDAWMNLDQLNTGPDSLPGSEFQDLRDKATIEVRREVGRWRKIKASLDDIQRPKGYKADVDRLIEGLDEVSSLYSRFASDLSQSSDVTEAKDLSSKREEAMDKPIKEQVMLLKKLGARQCLG